jgi:hypothetical protein
MPGDSAVLPVDSVSRKKMPLTSTLRYNVRGGMGDPRLRWLVETCVWLDVAKDHRQEQTLSVLAERIRLGDVSLLVPTVVLAGFYRHKARIVDERRRSLSTGCTCVTEAGDRFGDPMTKGSVLQHLNDVDHRMPLLGKAAARPVVRIVVDRRPQGRNACDGHTSPYAAQGWPPKAERTVHLAKPCCGSAPACPRDAADGRPW